MMLQLPDDLCLELERAGDRPLRVENPRNHRHYLIIAEEQCPALSKCASDSSSTAAWSSQKNARRFVLIDKQMDGTITAEEQAELDQLQREVDEYLDRVAPLPIAALQELHDKLRQSLMG